MMVFWWLVLQDEEREEVLEQYKNLTVEASSLQSQNSFLESNTSGLQIEIQGKDAELTAVRKTLAELDTDIQQHIHARSEYEIEVSTG